MVPSKLSEITSSSHTYNVGKDTSVLPVRLHTCAPLKDINCDWP